MIAGKTVIFADQQTREYYGGYNCIFISGLR